MLKEQRCFGGVQGTYRHHSKVLGCSMQFAVFVPETFKGERAPVLYFLSGLTCTPENFTTKAGAQQHASEHGIILVVPDTSPRGLELPGEHDSYDFGSGAGFYLDATVPPYSEHYRMHRYVTEELPALLGPSFPVDLERESIFGHSMGGHGALVLALRHPERYKSVSAFSPISAPSDCPWGQKAFSAYLGPNREAWAEWDATRLLEHSGYPRPILVDQGLQDEFLAEQLKPESLESAAARMGASVTVRRHPGYDHSYFFIQTFMGDHIRWHAEALKD
jgi:S-formylglutathione hydrolase